MGLSPFAMALMAAQMGPTPDDQQVEEIPKRKPPVIGSSGTTNRIDDEQQSGRRGGTSTGQDAYNPQARLTSVAPGTPATTTGSTYTGPDKKTVDLYSGQTHPFNPYTYPIEQSIEGERGALRQMSQPQKLTLGQRLGAALQGGAAGFATKGRSIEDQQQQLNQARLAKLNLQNTLAGRIQSNQMALANQGMETQRMEEQERLRAMDEAAQWDRMQATLGERMQQAGMQDQSREGIAAGNRANTANIAGQNRQAAMDRLNASQDFQRWKAKLDNDTKLRVAVLTQSKAPAAMMQTSVFSGGALDQISGAKEAMQDLEDRGVMGSLPANWIQNWLFSNGMVDPGLDAQSRADIGKLRAALEYTSSGAMRAHTGRTSTEIYNDFKQLMGPGQDWNALGGALDQTEEMLGYYARASSDQNIMKLRQGTAPGQSQGQGAPAQGQGPVRTIRID